MAIAAKVSVFVQPSALIKKGEITPAENQAAAIVFKNSDKPLSWAGFKFSIQNYHRRSS